MKKAAVAAAGMLAMISVLAGYQKVKTEETVQPLVAEAQEEKAVEEMKETEGFLDIDTSVSIQKGARVAVVSKNTKGQFWEQVRKGMADAVNAVNVAYGYEKEDQISMTFEGPDDEQKVEEQINTIDAVIAENPAVLCLSVGDMESCQAQLETARENGIPVIVFDSNVSETELISAFRGTDNVQVGEMAAVRLENALGGTGKIAVFSAQEKTESAKDRVNGFLKKLENNPDVEVVETVYTDQVEDMEAAMQEVLEKYPDLNGVFCTNADVSELYLDLEKEEDRQIVMVGVDATKRQVEAIRNGEEAGTVSQNPYAMGYQTILTALNETAPEEERLETEKNVLLEPVWIDSHNLEDPAYSSYIYE